MTDGDLYSRRTQRRGPKLVGDVSFGLAALFVASETHSPCARCSITGSVPLENYRQNLSEILDSCEMRECPVLCITAPSAFLANQLPDWAFSFFGQIYRMSFEEVASIPETHAAYHSVIRQLCADRDIAKVVDVAKHWSSEDQWDRLPERFRGDRIHLTDQGHREIAELCFQVYSGSLMNSGLPLNTDEEAGAKSTQVNPE